MIAAACLQVIVEHTCATTQLPPLQVHVFLLMHADEETLPAMLLHRLVGGAQFPHPARVGKKSRASNQKYFEGLKGTTVAEANFQVQTAPRPAAHVLTRTHCRHCDLFGDSIRYGLGTVQAAGPHCCTFSDHIPSLYWSILRARCAPVTKKGYDQSALCTA